MLLQISFFNYDNEGSSRRELHDRARIINVTPPPVIRWIFERPSSASKVSCHHSLVRNTAAVVTWAVWTSGLA